MNKRAYRVTIETDDPNPNSSGVKTEEIVVIATCPVKALQKLGDKTEGALIIEIADIGVGVK